MKDRFPGVPEWLFGLACTFLVAAETQSQGERQRPQSAASYYFDAPIVGQLHWAGMVLCGLVVLAVLVWLATPLKKQARFALVCLAIAGFLLAWGEVFYALQAQEGSIYILSDLPFRPVNNLGVIGAQVFGTYLILKSPAGRLVGWKAWAVRVGLAIGLWYFQFFVWMMAAT